MMNVGKFVLHLHFWNATRVSCLGGSFTHAKDCCVPRSTHRRSPNLSGLWLLRWPASFVRVGEKSIWWNASGRGVGGGGTGISGPCPDLKGQYGSHTHTHTHAHAHTHAHTHTYAHTHTRQVRKDKSSDIRQKAEVYSSLTLLFHFS